MFDRSDLTGSTTDALEQRLVAAERLIARLRADQTRVLRIMDAGQVPTGDGYRSLGDWTAARLDVTPETSARLVRLARVCHQRIDRRWPPGISPSTGRSN